MPKFNIALCLILIEEIYILNKLFKAFFYPLQISGPIIGEEPNPFFSLLSLFHHSPPTNQPNTM